MQEALPVEEMDRPRRNNHTGFSSVLRLSRTPFPSLTSYIAISFCISFIALANIMSVFKSQPELLLYARSCLRRMNAPKADIRTLLREEILNSSLTSTYEKEDLEYLSSLTIVQAVQYIKGNSPLIWVSINTYFAVLALIAKFVTKLTFKELTRQEEVIVSTSAGSSGGRLSWLCFSLFAFSVILIMLVIRFHDQINVSHMLFLLVDASLSLLRSLHGLLRCLSSSERFARSPDAVRHFNYWLDLSVTLATDTIQLFNYIHLMFMSPLGFNITSIVNTLTRHHKHNQIFLHIQSTYPNEMAEERDLCIGMLLVA
ncbi:hypothetical protein ANCDUO_17587 [Ancylostoma duodenale]|uniref:Uncharacterized protein n=1 Tax=Ancylostoma duodenale TaxID=51022 RepID=A0A0C2CR80_9BILA|nr:hypothetical protein ANCDUO_17587 [Ancylostoma duodenale]